MSRAADLVHAFLVADLVLRARLSGSRSVYVSRTFPVRHEETLIDPRMPAHVVARGTVDGPIAVHGATMAT